ncbi:hypothetical protein NIES4071_47580 [Calothrix sp. NIES-4071]|nr:hypothetical protein NIES4071_47580 [Calothrix sp. NIES-4071]BAZ59070.1 hypothetical protein NIES4105_47520 [Calothrix sp. NIES-4105]
MTSFKELDTTDLAEDIAIEGIELDEEEISEPFSPAQIRVDTRRFTISAILKKIELNEIELQPEFQRKLVWNQIAKSRLIESILIRIPIPIFYLDATSASSWMVIDGLQRFNTFKEFVIDKNLRLTGLQSFTQFNGKTYNELPRNYQRRLEETELTVVLVEKGTPKEFSKALFERINTSASALSAQEIRHALNQGKATKILETLANSVEFKNATDNGISSYRMLDRECILRVLAFIIYPNIEELNIKSIKKILDEAMLKINLMTDNEIDVIKNQFLYVMKTAAEIFDKNAFRKIYSAKTIKNPINKALFEAWSVSLYKLSHEEIELLKHRRDSLIVKIKDFTDEDKFDDSIYKITGNLKDALRRVNDIEKIIKLVLL